MKISAIIRPAKDSDIEKLIELLKVLFSIEKDFIFNEESQKRGLELMLQDSKSRCIFVAELQGVVIGMISAQALISTAEGGISVLVEDVVIDENYRGQGIGRELLKTMERWAIEKGARRLQLLADINNSSALTFYDKLNWKKTSLMCLQKKDV